MYQKCIKICIATDERTASLVPNGYEPAGLGGKTFSSLRGNTIVRGQWSRNRIKACAGAVVPNRVNLLGQCPRIHYGCAPTPQQKRAAPSLKLPSHKSAYLFHSTAWCYLISSRFLSLVFSLISFADTLNTKQSHITPQGDHYTITPYGIRLFSVFKIRLRI